MAQRLLVSSTEYAIRNIDNNPSLNRYDVYVEETPGSSTTSIFTFDIVLEEAITEDKTVNWYDITDDRLTFNVSSLTFTSDNWNVPQQLILTVTDPAQDSIGVELYSIFFFVNPFSTIPIRTLLNVNVYEDGPDQVSTLDNGEFTNTLGDTNASVFSVYQPNASYAVSRVGANSFRSFESGLFVSKISSDESIQVLSDEIRILSGDHDAHIASGQTSDGTNVLSISSGDRTGRGLTLLLNQNTGDLDIGYVDQSGTPIINQSNLVLRAENGNRFRISVGNNGELTTTQL